MKIKKIVSIVNFFVLSAIYGQEIKIGLETNTQYYIDDNKIKLDFLEKQHRFRANTYLKTDYLYNNFSFGVQAEAYTPKALLNYNPKLEKYHLGAVYAHYKTKKLDLTAGHIYEIFGSGLALRFWEDRALGINNALFGSRIKADFENVTFKVLAGKQRIGMGFDFSDGFVYGADAEFDISQLTKAETYSLKLGLTSSGRYENLSEGYNNVPKLVNIFGGRFDYQDDSFNVNGEYLYKSKDIHSEQNVFYEDIIRSGNALLINAGYSKMGFAVNVNARRLENFSFSSQRNIIDNQYNYGMINYLPALTKQYEHSLQNIYVYQAQPKMVYYDFYKKQGEIGGQFDVFFQAEEGSFFGGKNGASFAINGSYWNGLKNDVTKIITYDSYGLPIEKYKLETDYFSIGEKFYHDFAVEYRKLFSERVNGVFSYLNQFYNAKYLLGEPYEVEAHTLSGEVTYFFTPMKSLRFEGQHQWASSYLKNWVGGTLEFVPNSKYTFFVSDIYNYGNDFPEQRIHYYNVGASLVKKSTRVSLTYGRQRGGVVCLGGICRIIPESVGFSFSLTTNF